MTKHRQHSRQSDRLHARADSSRRCGKSTQRNEIFEKHDGVDPSDILHCVLLIYPPPSRRSLDSSLRRGCSAAVRPHRFCTHFDTTIITSNLRPHPPHTLFKVMFSSPLTSNAKISHMRLASLTHLTLIPTLFILISHERTSPPDTQISPREALSYAFRVTR